MKSNCCQNLLDEIKHKMLLRQKAYEANHQFAKAIAIKLMRDDLIADLECERVIGEVKNEI